MSLRRLLQLALPSCSLAFYIPGFSIHSYHDSQPIPLHVNKIFSDNTQLQYPYYDLPFVCPPTGQQHAGFPSGKRLSLNLGEVLRGDRIMTSDFDLRMGQDEICKYQCGQAVDRAGIRWARELIEQDYVVEWIVDNLPGATSFVTIDKSHKYYSTGFKLGYSDFSPATGKQRYFINNHFTLVIKWRKAEEKVGNRKLIVGFEVFAKSIELDNRNGDNCPEDMHADSEGLQLYLNPNTTNLADRFPNSSYVPPAEEIDDGAMMIIPYTYSVYFREDNNIEWSKRWDLYFNNQEESAMIHWLAIINSVIISAFLTAVVAMILSRTVVGDGRLRLKDSAEEGKKKRRRPATPKEKVGLLEQDASQEDEITSDEEGLEDITGWKLLHSDVFRVPRYASILGPLIGSGVQLVFTACGILLLSVFGVLNPSFRGGFVSVGLGLYILAGPIAGFYSVKLHKTLGGTDWRRLAHVTATILPGSLFCCIFMLNLFVWAQGSSTALPIGTLISLIALWLLVQLPLVYLGAWMGELYSKPFENPTKTSSIARQIPTQPWYSRSLYSVILAGLVPFAVIFIELLFVFRSIWQDKSGYYYVFGFLSVVSFVNIVTVMEVTIITIYIQLCAENYHWWWQSVATGAASGLWVYMYCVWFFWTRLHLSGIIDAFLFFSYCGIACTVYGLLMGSIGFLTAYTFVRSIYGAIKID